MVVRSRAVLALVTRIAHLLGTVPSWRRVSGFAFPAPLVWVDPDAPAASVEEVIAHERIHGDQWAECFLAGMVLLMPLTSAMPFPLWLLLVYNTWLLTYGALWLVGLVRYRSARQAYLQHPMEREAYQHAADPGYRDDRMPFAWMRLVK